MDYIRQVAPEAELSAINTGAKYTNGVLESKAIDWLMENTPDFLGTAKHGGFVDRNFMIPYYKKLYDKGCYLLCSAGNDIKEIRQLANGDMWKAIGACRLTLYGKDPVPKIEREYVDGEEMDYVSLHNLKATYDNRKHLGTSFSYPIFMGMLGLVQCFFIEKTGKKLTHEQLNKFVIDHCLDLGVFGKDEESGYGLFILPDPESIDVCKYTDEKVIENKEEENDMEIVEKGRYKYLKDIPEGEYHDVIKYLIDMDILQGRSGEGEDTEVDLSEDMVRMFVINFRAGVYDV